MESTTLLLIGLLCTASMLAHTINIQDLSTNPGLLTITSGQCFITKGQDRLYHEIDLDQYQKLLTNVDTIIQGLRHLDTFHDLTVLLSTKYNSISKLYNDLLPHKRTKRGAFNLLGSGIKIITGNLDDHDLLQINREISNLKVKDNSLIEQNNLQVRINKKIENQINKMTNTFNAQQSLITRELIKIKQGLNNRTGINNVSFLIQTFKTTYQLDQIEKELEAIFETTHLANLNVISRNILDKSELSLIKENLEKYNVTLQSFEQVYDLLGIRSVFRDRKLYFIIFIPQLESTTFNRILMEPLPIAGRIIKLPFTTALIGQNKTFLLRKECHTIGLNTMCNKDNLFDVSNDECFSKILRGLAGNCPFVQHNSNVGIIKRLTENHIIVKNSSRTRMSTDCNLSDRILKGTFLIYISNCSVTLDNVTYSNTVYHFKPPQTVIPLDGVKIEQHSLEPNITFEMLHELHLHSRKQISSLEIKSISHTYTCVGLATLSIISAIAITILIYINIQRRGTEIKKQLYFTSRNASTRKEYTITDSRRIGLEGGVVTEDTIYQKPATIIKFNNQPKSPSVHIG